MPPIEGMDHSHTSLKLGIDTGDTYTDAVLVGGDDEIVAAAKRLTTRHDLTIGIADVLNALPGESLREVSLVSLSTTLSTNSVVESRGAPARIFFPDSADHLGVDLVLPERAEVANAYGAVMGRVVQRAQVTVTHPLYGRFVVHSDHGPKQFSDLQEALNEAEQIAGEKVQALAMEAGAASAEIRITNQENLVNHDVDGDLFLETRVIATATGRPDIRKI